MSGLTFTAATLDDFWLWTSDFGFYLVSVSRKSKRVADMVADYHGRKLNPHYLGYFHCFNKQLFYEAHEVLEHLWLRDRHGPNALFYKGLIQLAGAFVHLQRNHLQPAAALFRLACANFEKYPRIHEHLNLETVCKLARQWLAELERTGFGLNPLANQAAPELQLESSAHD